MKRSFVAAAVLAACLTVPAQQWVAFQGPAGEEWSRLGTDGTNLYMTTGGNQLWMYSWPPGLPNLGQWTRLPDCPRTIDAWDSYRGLAHQNGYLYTSALAVPGPYRTIVRYHLATATWEAWGNPTLTGSDLNICNTSGNALFMDPVLPGVGYSAWHAGGWWVTFDWNAQTTNNNWMSTTGLSGSNPTWVSRNEDFADDGAGTFYSMKNDWTAGLSSGDLVYSFTMLSPAADVVQKPWQAGAGQTLEFLPAAHPLNITGFDELWLLRGGDGAVSPHEGWSSAGTTDWGVYDLVNATWMQLFVPLYLGHGSDSVKIGNYVFVKASGDATSATVYNTDFLVAMDGPAVVRYGQGCPGAGGEPALTAPGGPPAVGNLGFQLGVSGAAVSAPALLGIGLSNLIYQGLPLPLDLAPYGASGCLLNTAIDASTFLLLDPTGAGAMPMPLPNYPPLAGFQFFAQWFVLDAAAPNPRSVAASQGGRVQLQ
jgi:hypothetical protein